MDELFTRYKVQRFYCDPQDWRSEIGDWALAHGDDHVFEWATNRISRMYDDPESIFLRVREEMPCNCPKYTPVAIRIPRVNPLELTPQEKHEYEENDFMLDTRCVRCRTRLKVMAPLSKIPVVTRATRQDLAQLMKDNGCIHQEKHWFLTEPVSMINDIPTVVVDGEPSFLCLVYCRCCRHVVQTYIPESDLNR